MIGHGFTQIAADQKCKNVSGLRQKKQLHRKKYRKCRKLLEKANKDVWSFFSEADKLYALSVFIRVHPCPKI